MKPLYTSSLQIRTKNTLVAHTEIASSLYLSVIFSISFFQAESGLSIRGKKANMPTGVEENDANCSKDQSIRYLHKERKDHPSGY